MTKHELALESLDQGQAGLPVLGAGSGRAEAESSHFPHQPGEEQAGPCQPQLWTDHSLPLSHLPPRWEWAEESQVRGVCAETLMPPALWPGTLKLLGLECNSPGDPV